MGGAITLIVLLFTWLGGIALAQGFVSTLIAAFIPFWAWYLFVERALTIAGWMGA